MTDGKGGTTVPVEASSPLVSRSDVPGNLEYPEYREFLRYDFFYSCAYCTMSESEAQAIRFAIDHYEPRKARPELEHQYDNLMYSCDPCNERKGDRCPPVTARADGYRFFRPDQDVFGDHFALKGIRLEPKTNVGMYSVEALDLNREGLRRLRDIRARITKCDRLVAAGILALRNFPLDQLPKSVKGKASRAIKQARNMETTLVTSIDALLRKHAHSELIDPDKNSETRAKERSAKLAGLQALYGGRWRAPRKGGR